MGKFGTWAAVAAFGTLGFSSIAWAGDASTQAAAEALFRQGRDLMQQGNFAEACPKLRESQRLDPGAGTLLNLASCYEKNGQSASAWATYGEAATTAARSGRNDWEAVARDRAGKLEPTLSTLTIVVPASSDVPGLGVERDGLRVERAQWGLPIPVDPGVHPVAATAPRKQQWSTTVTVGANAAKASVTIPPLVLEQGDGAGAAPVAGPTGPIAQPEPRPAGATDAGADDGSSQRTWGLVLGGVGIAGLAAGSVFGLMAKSKHDEALDQCDANNRCTQRAIDLDDQARSRATVSTILFGTGAAALVGGGILYFTAPSGEPKWTVNGGRRARTKATSAARIEPKGVSVGAAPTPGGAAFSMQGVW